MRTVGGCTDVREETPTKKQRKIEGQKTGMKLTREKNKSREDVMDKQDKREERFKN